MPSRERSGIDMRFGRAGAVLVIYFAASAIGSPAALGQGRPWLPAVRANDNRHPAGSVSLGLVHLTLTARWGRWYPDGDRRPAALVVPAFAVAQNAPSIPGPLIRVRAGTSVRVTVRNALDGPLGRSSLFVHGLHDRLVGHGATARGAPLRVAPGSAREVTFVLGAPGTYYYWAALTDTATIADREGVDAALGGAIVVDPSDTPPVHDRIFVIDRMVLPPEGEGPTRQPQRFVVTVNGLSWPLTERLDFAVGDTVRWRWINSTSDHHPMHLHGFYYQVNALGDENADTNYAAAERSLVVTQRMVEGGTMALTWAPERAGNWLVHCHLRAHSGPDSTWGFPDVQGTGAFGDSITTTRHAVTSDRRAGADDHGAISGAVSPAVGEMGRDMAGLVIGIRVRPSRIRHHLRGAVRDDSVTHGRRHEVRLTVDRQATATGHSPRITVRVEDERALGGSASAQSAGAGPPIMLRRGEPTRIVVVNTLSEATAIHWHGIELESYFDGVPGWTGGPGGGGAGGRRSPEIAAGDSFAALMTPPRAGTFIYHSHALSTDQLGDGLYGPLIVLDSGDSYDPTREILWVVGGHERDNAARAYLVLNGERVPPPLSIVRGRHYHVRLINISESNTADVALLDGDGATAIPVTWRPLAKDAVSLRGPRAAVAPARLRSSVGESYDFELTPQHSGTLLLEVRNGGDLMVSQRVNVQ